MVGKTCDGGVTVNDPSIELGKILSNVPPGEEVVISGLAGRYPASEDVQKYKENLFNKVNMTSEASKRWQLDHAEIPKQLGIIPELEKFDAGFFGLSNAEVTSMEPVVRVFLELAIEAVFDAGLHPSDLEDTKTGVFVGACFDESENYWYYENDEQNKFVLTGNTKSVAANRLSKFLKLKGPSYVCDTACSSSHYALENAYKAMRTGICDRAFVAGTNICLHPFLTLQFARLGVLSRDGICRPFDETANGYVRAEAACVVLLEKSKDAKRIYATVVHAKTGCDGFKEQGITYPSGDDQRTLMREFYEECGVNPADLTFVEAHGTGTSVGDPEELMSIEHTVLKGRKEELLIGSVKGNIGHSEPVSGLCSVTKAIIAFETGYIPPNINYRKPKKITKMLLDGRARIVTETTPLPNQNGLIAVNSFGFGGANCHVLLRWNPRGKKDKNITYDNIPRIVYVSGRTEHSIHALLDDVNNNNVDTEHVRLLQDVFRKNIIGHLYRGYSITSKSGEIKRSLRLFSGVRKPLYICFGDVEFRLLEKAKGWSKLPIFQERLERLNATLSKKGLDITKLLNNNSLNPKEKMIGSLTVEAALADILKELEVKPIGVFGQSFGELVCAYFDGTLSFDQAVDALLVVTSKETDQARTSSDAKTVAKIRNDLKTKLKGLLPGSKQKNGLWLSNTSENLVEHLVDALVKPEVNGLYKKLKKNSVVLEIGKLPLPKNDNFEVVSLKDSDADITGLLDVFGRLYEMGFNPQIHKLYPKVDFPVTRGTPMISSTIKWNHSKDWFVKDFSESLHNPENDDREVTIALRDEYWTFVSGHCIEERNLFPATGYLYLIWTTIADKYGKLLHDCPITFLNCKFRRACTVPKEKEKKLVLFLTIQRASGDFEITEGGTVIVTGTILNGITEEPFKFSSLGGSDEEVPLNKKDIYKELRLRGYNYKGIFRSLMECNTKATEGKIQWVDNWIAFADNMLQIKILQQDTRLLYVPTSIKRMTINPAMHMKYIEEMKKDDSPVVIPVYASKDCGIIQAGGIEIRGLHASSIPRKREIATPVLEKHVFVPNEAKLPLSDSLRVNLQIILENDWEIKFKVFEVIDEGTTQDDCLAPIIQDVLGDQPLIQADITILSKNNVEVEGFKVEKFTPASVLESSLVVGSKILERKEILNPLLAATTSKGYIISRESPNLDLSKLKLPINIITVHETEQGKIVLFKNQQSEDTAISHVQVNNKELSWLPELQKAVAKQSKVVVVAENETLSGVLGLVNCIRKEPGCSQVKCVFLMGEAPKFSVNNEFYRKQLNKNLAINVFKNGQWGTYRHLRLGEAAIKSKHCYVNTTVRGDLSSLRWIEGILSQNEKVEPETELVHVHYASMNFRDIMLASGKINIDVVAKDRRNQDCTIGCEFSGVTTSGRRVMGLVCQGSFATMVPADKYTLWDVPDNWSLEEAATVPCVYGTSLLALLSVGKMKSTDTVLIHAGTGGIGQSAINLCLHMGCKVFTTVGTKEKREFIRKQFPQITDEYIGNSRDVSFQKQIMKVTNGRGVDIVLNSLSEEKLLTSIRCLAKGGRFLEIGKFDIANDNRINLLLTQKGASFHGVMLDEVFVASPSVKKYVYDLLQEGIRNGSVKPLGRTVFKSDQAEQAFRYMGAGKHMGKVLVQIREEQQNGPIAKECIPRYYCDSSKTYVICGGLGGFGLELADWLILRGARKLVLTSRTGVQTGYQHYRIQIWKSYGCEVHISTADITTKNGCQQLLQEAGKLGSITAIFNLAVVLRDSILANQSKETFETSFGPKAYATEYLDTLTRKMCPELKDFVVFSSVSCGRGNGGQTNYGMSNSIMERICEKRREEGYPGLAIQWGAIGNVGLLADLQEEHIEMEIGGTLQQSITSSLKVMDVLLRQHEASIVSSIVVAEKKSGLAGSNAVDSVMSILGINDLKSVSQHSTLAELGMDSMSAVEVKQTLEREFEIVLTPDEIRSLTLAKIIEFDNNRTEGQETDVNKAPAELDISSLLRFIGEEDTYNIPLLNLNTQESTAPTVVCFPGVEGVAVAMKSLASKLKANVYCVQYCEGVQASAITATASNLSTIIKDNFPKTQALNFIAHSIGVLVAMEVVSELEKLGYNVTLTCIDGSPDVVPKLVKSVIDTDDDEKLQLSLIMHTMSFFTSTSVILKHKDELSRCKSYQEKIKLAQDIVGSNAHESREHQRNCALSAYNSIKSTVQYRPSITINSKVTLYKPTVMSLTGLPEDYGLSAFCKQPVETKIFEGNHATILENDDLADDVNRAIV